MVIVGIGGILKDASAALLSNGELCAAIEQGKISRDHRPGKLPEEAIAECLRIAKASPEDVACAALVRPIGSGPETALHLQLRAMFPNAQVVLVDHHMAHAASAFYPSGFDEATVLTLDRQGDLRCGALWQGKATDLRLVKEQYYPDSLGDLYSRVTALLGFEPGADEHKVQWLSASGGSRLASVFEDILDTPKGQWPRIDRTCFDANRISGGGFSARFLADLGLKQGSPISAKQRAEIAGGLQGAIEKSVVSMAGKGRNLAVAGGLAYNAMLIEALEKCGNWDKVFVQPASGNAGLAVGAVYHAWHSVMHKEKRAGFPNLYLGPSFSAEEIKQVLENCKLRFRYLLTTGELIHTAVEELSENRIIAWMHGRMEFGPRALGNRSILASPTNPYSTENLNIFIKRREAFRKFAASVPEELASDYFEVGENARFLATVGRVKKAYRPTFEPAILGKDIVRVHLVRRRDNELYWSLLHAAGKKTGLPVLYNTSFNLFGDPLVCTPRDAVRSFYSSGIDSLFVGNFFLQK